VKHYVRICRLRFEVMMVEVEGDDHDSAELLALARADDARAPDWQLLPFDKNAYRLHVERCLSADDIALATDDGESEVTAVANARSLEPDEDTRYHLLHADVNSGEGEVILQPWFADEGDLMQHDLSKDWIATLSQYVDEGFEGLERAVGSIVPFPGRGSDDPEN
jgi:hypothetical protein